MKTEKEPIQPLYFEANLLLTPKEQKGFELVVAVNDAIENKDREEMMRLIPECAEFGNGHVLAKKLEKALNG